MNRAHIIALGMIVALFPAITSLPALAEETAPFISNFKFGLVCGVPGNRRVCFSTNVIQVTNESGCVSNYVPIRCTWYGYSFDYDAPADVTINCDDWEDVVTAHGNPYEVFSPSQETKFDLELKKGQHHFFVGQYVSGYKNDLNPRQGKESCSLAGTSLFSTEYRYEFADETAPVESVPDVNGRPPPRIGEEKGPAR